MPKDMHEYTDPKHKNFCPNCKTAEHAQLKNHSAIWGDGDIICSKCNYYIRMYDAG